MAETQKASPAVIAARRIDTEWVSCRILQIWLGWSAAVFCSIADLEVKQPTSEQEIFMRIDDLPKMLEAARKSRPDVAPDALQSLMRLINGKGIAGLTDREAKRRNLI